MLVIANNLIRAAAIKLGKSGGAPGDGGEILQQLFLLARGTHPLVALPQGLQDRLCQTFARQARERAGETLDFGVADTERHDWIIYNLEWYIQERTGWYIVAECRDNAGENPVRPICFVIASRLTKTSRLTRPLFRPLRYLAPTI